MSQPEVYQEIVSYLEQQLRDPQGRAMLGKRTLARVALLAGGMLKAQHGAPAKIGQAAKGLSERGVQGESVERRIRRIENDPQIRTETCFDPLVKRLLAQSQLHELLLIVDPTLQEDRVVMVSLNAWYRGRSLPLAWVIWPANRPLEGAGFWQRIDELLTSTQRLLPPAVAVTVLADRAFGTPAFTDRVASHGWHWIVRVQGQTCCREASGREQSLAQLVGARGQRRKLSAQVFKKAGWRPASIVVYWGRRYPTPLCLVTDRAPDWGILAQYRHRFAIEPTFRDEKSYGWHWEQGQVTNLEHLQHLLVGMALASWLTILVGALQAHTLLTQPPSGKRHTRPPAAKQSLFQLGLQVWREYFEEGVRPWLWSALPDWEAPNWSTQITAYHVRAFVFA
jgi:hypothetical protein